MLPILACLLPVLLVAGWLVALGMLAFLFFYETYSWANTIAALFGFSVALALYWWWRLRRLGDGPARAAFVGRYAKVALVASGLVGVWVVYGVVLYGLHLLAPTWMMPADQLAIYQSRQAFIASAVPFREPRPRLMYAFAYRHSGAWRMVHSSKLLRDARRTIFAKRHPKARLAALPVAKLDALIEADRTLATVSHSDYGYRKSLPFWISAVLLAFAVMLHWRLLAARSRATCT